MKGRAPSRGGSRSSASSSSSASKKTTKLPQIGGLQEEESAPQNYSQNNSGLVHGVCSQQGKRPYQEDEYSIRPYLNQSSSVAQGGEQRDVETHFFGLFDGHAGGRCSSHIAACLGNVIAEDGAFVSNLPQALKRSFHVANEQFLKIAEKMKYHDGSTGLVAIVRDRKVLVANVGDCRALIVSNGRPIQMSIDQKPTSPDEQKRIAALGGSVVYCMGVARVNRVLAVSRAFGNRTLRSVIRPDAEMMQRELTKDDDYLVMASDGLWDVLKNKDVCDMCYSPFAKDNPQAIAEELVQAALMRGSMDNVTCVCVKLSGYVQRMLNAAAANSNNNVSGGSSDTARQQPPVKGLEKSASLRGIGQRTTDNSSGSAGYAELLRSRAANSSGASATALGQEGIKGSHSSSSNNAINHSMPSKQYSLNSISPDNSSSDVTSSNSKPKQQLPYPLLRMATTHNAPDSDNSGGSAEFNQLQLPSAAGASPSATSSSSITRRSFGEDASSGSGYSPGGLFAMSPGNPNRTRRDDSGRDGVEEEEDDFSLGDDDDDDNQTLVVPRSSASAAAVAAVRGNNSNELQSSASASQSGYAPRRSGPSSNSSSSSSRNSGMPNLISMFSSSNSVSAPNDQAHGRSGGSAARSTAELKSDSQQSQGALSALFASNSRKGSRK